MTKLAVAMAVVSAAACTPEPILAPSQKQFASGATQEEEFILGDIQLMQDAPFKEIDLTGEDSLSSNPDSLTNKSD